MWTPDSLFGARSPWSRRELSASVDRLLVILSDIEMGAGGRVDDFPHSDFLADLLLAYNDGPTRELPVELVFNGDTFDLLKTAFRGTWPRHITAAVALEKLAAIAAAHPRFFAAVGEFLAHSHAERRVHFVVGNHDAELFFPEVQAEVARLCGGDPRISFPGLRLQTGRVWIEHGSQLDPLFAMDEAAPFVEMNGAPVLNLSWGAASLLDTVIPLQSLLGFHDRVKPRSVLLKLMPEIQELLMERFWSYWMRDFWKGYFRGSDPTKKLSWSMLKEVLWRFGSKNPELQLSDQFTQRMVTADDYLLYVLGHQHQPQWKSHGDRKVLEAGCLRNEYMLHDQGRVLRPIPKCYVEAWLREGTPVVSHFVEFEGPPPPPGYLPRSIFEVLPEVQALISPRLDPGAALDQERKEAKRSGD